MWPVLTLTLLLQLTDDEQLFAASEPPPAVQQVQGTDSCDQPQNLPVLITDEDDAA